MDRKQRVVYAIYKIYWSQIDNIIAPMHTYNNKMNAEYGDIVWSKVDKVKISNYYRMQSYIHMAVHSWGAIHQQTLSCNGNKARIKM